MVYRKRSIIKCVFDITEFKTAANIQLCISLSKPQHVQNCSL